MPVTVAAGVYRHYKADRCYLVLGLGHDANAAGRTVVVYVPLYLDAGQSGPRLAVRTLEDFSAWVDPGTGATVEADTPGGLRRFTFIPDTTAGDA